MSHALRVDPRDAVPIWRQIEDGMRRLVASGSLPLQGAVPSVRELARDLGVNPMTVSKAYQRLTEAGVFEVRRGEGTFVASSLPSVGRAERARNLKTAALRYGSLAVTQGASEAEATAAVAEAWSSLTRRPGGEQR